MPHIRIILYSVFLTNRLQYSAELVFQDLLGLRIVFTQDKNVFLSSKLPKINYSPSPLIHSQELYIKNQTLLFENQLTKEHIDVDFSLIIKRSPLQFDFLAMIFLLVSRYEEYVADASGFDKHNRFSAKKSLAYKYGFLQNPIVNQWIIQINAHLNTLFPELKTTLPTYRFQPTFDIDMPWKYKNKGILRSLGGILKDILKGDFAELKKRINILRGRDNDPDFTFDYIFSLHKAQNEAPVFFLLLGDYGTFDKNPNEHNKSFRKLIHLLSTSYRVGLHPSYHSNSNLMILEKEKARFERMTDLPLEISRQHFLKLRFPETYHRLVSVGIKQDYSMGYADETGFRASIATPFRWFDLSKNEITDLWIYPFQVMDVTLKDYLKLTPYEAVERTRGLIEATKAVGGTFITLWHNSSFSNTEGWESWREVYEEIIKIAPSDTRSY